MAEVTSMMIPSVVSLMVRGAFLQNRIWAMMMSEKGSWVISSTLKHRGTVSWGLRRHPARSVSAADSMASEVMGVGNR